MTTNEKRKEMLKRIRDKVLKKKGGRRRDPSEWKAPNIVKDSELKLKCNILPPLKKGDACATGVCDNSMDEVYFVQVGDHWINKKPYPCPRIYDGNECLYCQLGFDLMQETDDKEVRRELAKAYLPQTKYALNVYFTDAKTNPEDLRGVVKWYLAPRTIADKFDECLNRDDAGEDLDDPQPFGFFYDPDNSYTFQIHITKNGEYNDYKLSKFLVASRGPIAEGEELEKILSMRHDLLGKFPKRDQENYEALKKFADDILNGGDDDSDKTNDSGFDSDEMKEESSPPKPVKEEKSEEKPKEEKKSEKSTKSTKTKSDEDKDPRDVLLEEDAEFNELLRDIAG